MHWTEYNTLHPLRETKAEKRIRKYDLFAAPVHRLAIWQQQSSAFLLNKLNKTFCMCVSFHTSHFTIASVSTALILLRFSPSAYYVIFVRIKFKPTILRAMIQPNKSFSKRKSYSIEKR